MKTKPKTLVDKVDKVMCAGGVRPLKYSTSMITAGAAGGAL
jgi:hypothetical protein